MTEQQTDTNPTREAEESAPEQGSALVLEAVRETAITLNPGMKDQIHVTLDSRLDRDLGIDSLGRVALLARIEKAFDVTLGDEVLAGSETPRDILRAVGGAAGGRAMRKTVELPDQVTAGVSDDLPRSARTIPEVLEWYAERHGDHPHIRLYSDEDEGEVITYADLLEDSSRVAGGLRAMGLGHRQAVILMLATGRDYFATFMGVLLAGGIPVPIYPPTRPSQIEDHLLRHAAIMDNCQATMMVTLPEAAALGQLMRARAKTMRKVVTTQDLRDASPGPYREPDVTSEDTAFIQYTSGSTGTPKGVVLSHANLLANIRAMRVATKVSSDDVFISWLPLYHDMGLIGAWFGPLYTGARLVIMSPLVFLTRPSRWLWAIHRYRGTVTAAPNFAYELCLKRIEDEEIEGLELSSLRASYNGAEAVSPDTMAAFTDRFKAFGLREEAVTPVYGLAEDSVGLAFPPNVRVPRIDRVRRAPFLDRGEAVPADAGDSPALRFVGCGVPLSGHQIRIVDRMGREMPDRQEGRLQFKGPSATRGYLRAPDQNRELFDGEWLNSGDLAYMVDGEIFITGRAKDVIIRAGRNLYPAEMEDEIGRLDGVRDGRVAVFGAADQESGTEKLVVMAETRDRDETALARLRADINGVVTDLAGSPADMVALVRPGTVLKTSSGKIRRAACRELYESGDLERGAPPIWWQLARVALTSLRPLAARGVASIAHGLFALWCWLLIVVGAVPYWLALVLLPKRSWRWTMTRFGFKGVGVLSTIPVRVKGVDRLPADSGPVIFVANHQSYVDGLVYPAMLPRDVDFVAKAEFRSNPFMRLGLERIGVVWAERFDASRGVENFQTMIDRVKAGRSLMLFPEGTFTRMPGLMPFRMGAFELAVAAGVPVVPLVLHGGRAVLREKSWFPRRAPLTLTMGEPLTAIEEGDDFTRAVDLRDRVRAWMLRHCGEPDLSHQRLAKLVRGE